MNASEFDLQATVARLFVYPIKSCAGVELKESLLIETGLEFDRAWMVVDAHGEFVSQRELPRMALIRPTMKHSEMVLRAPGMLALHIAFDRVEEPVRVRVWDDEVAAYDMGNVAAQWFSDFLSEPGKPQTLRLVRFDPEQKRLSSRKWTGDVEAENQFADGFPLLVIGDGSLAELNSKLVAAGHGAVAMERFRPNVVLSGLEAHDEDRVGELHVGAGEDGAVVLRPVKPCPRCPIPDIDPATALSSPEVGDMLRTYRADPRVDGAITFGMNTIIIEGIEQTLKVGQAVGANLRFE
ncbi:MOSC N-terminal beta barrel domain-containing protein [Variovorax sp. J22R133]|uniref:MOSC domain-containing protein n=1 Tax=Variovorax brevis TaxID=3053503 RepID=UPI0025781921|nr:MOSC N-terminal beta barrel domain-containing protein [Variovorax sp. J22R133]MDM0114932.1 MOSC N-terminal beta barrel domain-containing protein [Variovorax sp. J22R133]